ncbi:MAG: leader peptidase (prepilin peptidase) / N-methyltransferase [Solirubrobacteraceae bacterium]|jgi:leader peptidase (prepilin peptidase)/N-methyltransferase|nr:prepilin peptidase [Solirubrobacterales bacterium]MEA2216539.1 leader peptidase (prepilin peptidase) / N-methyltransferase [Solirubrobacteraceae bacterium]
MEAATFAGVLGAIIGSFLNVVVYRLPRHESLIRPASHCPGCGAPVKPYDNIPVLSWLLLRGHCRACGEAISVRYPLVELITGALCVGAVLAGGSASRIALGIGLILLVVPVALIDLETRLIPNKLTLPGAVLALALGLALDPGGEPSRLIAAAAAGGFLLLAALAYPGGMGMGDVKLAGVMGLFLGSAVAPALLIALLAGTLVGAVIIARKGASAGRKTAVPFGPFLALGAIVAVFAGHPLVHVYVNHFLH